MVPVALPVSVMATTIKLPGVVLEAKATLLVPAEPKKFSTEVFA